MEEIRRIDDLGRVVIPKEIRRALRILEGQPLKVKLEDDHVRIEKFEETLLLRNELSEIISDLKAAKNHSGSDEAKEFLAAAQKMIKEANEMIAKAESAEAQVLLDADRKEK